MAADDLAGVQACIQAYFDGLYLGDPDLLFGKAFHPEAIMNCADLAGQRIRYDMTEYEKVVRERGAPKDAGFPRFDRIIAVDFAGPDTANVKVEAQVALRHYTDFLALIKIDGAWKIIAKTYCLTREFATREEVAAAYGA